MKKLLTVLFAVLMLVTVCGCGKKEEVVEGPDTWTNIESFDLTSLDYVYNNKSSNGDYLSNGVEGLVTQDPHGYLVPGMATEWSSNPEATEWTFTIREGAKWVTNAQEEYADVKAEDFVTGLRHAAEAPSQTLSLVLYLIKGLEEYCDGTGAWDEVGISVEGNKLTYTLNDPCPYFPSMCTYSILWPINEDWLNSQGEGCKLGAWDQANCKFGAVDPSTILYNSAYIMASHTAKSSIELVRNEKYWDVENCHIAKANIIYSDGSDPTQNFNMFVNGEVTSTGVNLAYPEIVEVANEKYADNMYLTTTTSSTFWGAFNFLRRSMSLMDDGVSYLSDKTQEEVDQWNIAVLNKNFRLAIYAAYSSIASTRITVGDELAGGRVRNTLTPWSFVTLSDGTAYGELVQKYLVEMEPEFEGIDLTDGHDAWYNPELAAKFMAKAVEELGDQITWPLRVEMPFLDNGGNNSKIALAEEQSIEEILGDYIDIKLVGYATTDDYYYAFYDTEFGYQNSVDLVFGAGWGPDYADPRTYLDIYQADNGDMCKYSGLNIALDGTETDEDRAVKETIGLYEYSEMVNEAIAITDDNDARYELFAKAEAYLLANGIIRPYSTSGANKAISTVVPFSGAYGLYGQASYNRIPCFKYMQLADHIITTEEYDAAKAKWLKGE